MTANSFLWCLSVFWAAAYTIRATRKHRNSSLLPSDRLSTHNSFGNSKVCKVTLQNFHLKVETRTFNEKHDNLTERLAKPTRRRLRATLKGFYDLGAVFGAIGMIAGLAILLYSCFSFVHQWNVWEVDTSAPKTRLKREVKSMESLDESTRSGFGINPIIPGVTVPWSHLPFLLLALFCSQCIHEAGHAIAAALDAVTLHSVGVSLTLVLPSAFVSLSPSLSTYSAPTKLRIIAAGAWHNLVLCAMIWSASFFGAGKLWTRVGWKDVSDIGVVVLRVEPDSALVHHLMPGTVIINLDDTHLASADRPAEAWTRYLLATPESRYVSQGWCVDAALFNVQQTACCNTDAAIQSPTAHLSCFEATEGNDPGRCLDPVLLFAPSSSDVKLSVGRCFTGDDCRARSETIPSLECVRLAPREDILRIVLKSPIWEDDTAGERVVLWSGPTVEVWDQVTIGTLSPQVSYLPMWLPDTFALFFQYLNTLSLSLYIFNLFSLPFLDGSQLFSAILDLLQPGGGSYEYDIPLDAMTDAELGSFDFKSGGEPRSRRNWRNWLWKRRTKVERAVKYTTIVLMILTNAIVALSSIG